jgi:hypothetical protein
MGWNIGAERARSIHQQYTIDEREVFRKPLQQFYGLIPLMLGDMSAEMCVISKTETNTAYVVEPILDDVFIQTGQFLAVNSDALIGTLLNLVKAEDRNGENRHHKTGKENDFPG